MYLEHYNLHTKPFQITTDPRFLWLGENHKEALAILKYGILDNKGFLLLTGDVGTGKTTLINALIDSLGSDVIVATVTDPDLGLVDFLHFIARSFKINSEINSKGDFLLQFQSFLKHAFRKKKKVLLVIDEAQRLHHDIMEEIRLLSNIELKNTKLLNIFFVGQNEFNDILWEKRNRALRQRITVSYNVYPLNESETARYIHHRLNVAGSQKPIFSRDAIREIASFSEGFPRTINIICDHALLTGYVKGFKKIDTRTIRECAADLQIPKRTSRETHHNALSPPVPEDQPRDLLRTSAYLSVIIMVLLLAGSFLLNSSSNAWVTKFNTFWGRLNTNTPRQTIGTIPPAPEADADQPFAETPSAGATHPIQKSKETLPAETVPPAQIEPVQPIPPPLKQKTKSIPSDQAEAEPDEINKDEKIIIYFPHDSNDFSARAIDELDRVARFLMKHTDIIANTVGYTDTSGVYSYNKSLSRFRANIVKSYLIGKGVDPGQLKSIGMGPSNPQGDNATITGRKSNRRVEILFDHPMPTVEKALQ